MKLIERRLTGRAGIFTDLSVNIHLIRIIRVPDFSFLNSFLEIIVITKIFPGTGIHEGAKKDMNNQL